VFLPASPPLCHAKTTIKVIIAFLPNSIAPKATSFQSDDEINIETMIMMIVVFLTRRMLLLSPFW
jgi:hypothetical protein